MSERLYVIDASALGAYKFFSVSDNSEHTTLIEGVRFWLADFIATYRPAHVVAVGDCSRATNWRKKKYVEYKASRDIKEKDPFLVEGLRQLPEVFEAEGVPWFRCDEHEGDDLCAAFAARHDGEVVVISNDKDLFQLVDDRVKVFSCAPNRDGVCVFYDAAAVTKKMDVPPRRIRELLAIEGDKSDNIPGVKGLGHVFAVTAIKQTRSRMELERRGLAGELGGITPRNLKIFQDGFADYKLSLDLVSLRFDAPIPEDFDTRLQTTKGTEQ